MTQEWAWRCKRIYLAARFSRRDEVREYGDQLRGLGYTISAQWLTTTHVAPDNLDEEHVRGYVAENIARVDIADIMSSDAVIMFTESPRSGGRRASRGGRHVEFGLALALMKRIIVVGPIENTFYTLPQAEVVKTWAEAKELLAAGGHGG